MQHRKPIIGLTGGMASGKSLIAKMFKDLGNCDVISADQVNAELMQPGNKGYDGVIAIFGKDILVDSAEEGSNPLSPIDRTKLRELVFTETPEAQANLKLLEDTLYPLIIARCQELFNHSTKDYIIWEVPLLIEKKWYVYCDEVVTVYCDRQTQIQRALERNSSYTLKVVVDMLNKQATNQERVQRSRYVILNQAEVTIEDLKEKVAIINQMILDEVVSKFRRIYY